VKGVRPGKGKLHSLFKGGRKKDLRGGGGGKAGSISHLFKML